MLPRMLSGKNLSMSTVRKGTLVPAKSGSRGPHLCKDAKRKTAKAERAAAKLLLKNVPSGVKSA